MLIVLTTTPNIAEAESLAEGIVEARLAACVQVLPQMTSIYLWEGKVRREGEYLVLVKTLPEKWEDLRDFITANHSYDVPEIVAIGSKEVSEPYLRWINEVLESGKV
ncbi:MAG: divalent-cation tolerance protein CutA [Pyrinomonadaceae bacterium]